MLKAKLKAAGLTVKLEDGSRNFLPLFFVLKSSIWPKKTFYFFEDIRLPKFAFARNQ